MSKGDVISDIQSIEAAAFLDIHPALKREWVVNNIFFNSSVELYWSDGVNNLLCDCYLGFGRWSWEVIHLTNSIYLRVKNVSNTATLVGYSGIILK
jgi:hypothetical protein